MFRVAGYGIDYADQEIKGAVVTHVLSFAYSGSILMPDTRSIVDIRWRIVLASFAFGSLQSVLLDDQLSLATRRRLYSACVLTVLLYGAQCWAPPWTDLQVMNAFHHQCLCDMLVLSWERWKSDRVTSARLRSMWSDTVSITYCVRQR